MRRNGKDTNHSGSLLPPRTYQKTFSRIQARTTFLTIYYKLEQSQVAQHRRISLPNFFLSALMVSHDISTTVSQAPIPRSRFSTLSADSRCNLVSRDEDAPDGGLPTYSTTNSKYPDSRFKTRLAGIFRGWRVIVLGSCEHVMLYFSVLIYIHLQG